MLRPWGMPEPLLPMAVEARAKADEDKLGPGAGAAGRRGPDAAHRAQRGDPPDRALDDGRGARRRACSTGSRTGTASASTRSTLRVPLRETFAGPAAGTAGTSSSPAATASSRSATSRWSRCPAGSGFEFVDKVVGGAVPRQFIPSVEKGVRAQMERGRRRRLPGGGHPGDAAATARRTASTPPTWPSRPPARWRCGRRPPRPGRPARAGRRGRRAGARRPRRHRDERPVRAARARCWAASRPAATARWCGPRCRRWRSAATPSTCGRSRTAPRRSPAASRATSRCRTTVAQPKLTSWRAAEAQRTGSAGWIASGEREARCASQWSTSSS